MHNVKTFIYLGWEEVQRALYTSRDSRQDDSSISFKSLGSAIHDWDQARLDDVPFIIIFQEGHDHAVNPSEVKQGLSSLL